MNKINLFNNASDFQYFAAGETIFKEGEIGNLMYAVIEGEILIQVGGHLLTSVEPGSIVGEMALVEKSPHSATAIAKTNCKLVPINEKRFLFLVQNTPRFSIQVMQIMAERLRRMNSILNE